VIDVGERGKGGRHPEDRRHAPLAVPAIPMVAMGLTHGSKTGSAANVERSDPKATELDWSTMAGQLDRFVRRPWRSAR
jgi:hypothetical protein